MIHDLTTAIEKIDEIEKRVLVLEHETSIQFKELFIRLKRIEGLLIGAASAIIILLATILWSM
tara:strand:+ start:1568 stop:1756 length:189 start_codon:yes stop_codon:yes gene_type:complete